MNVKHGHLQHLRMEQSMLSQKKIYKNELKQDNENNNNEMEKGQSCI